MDEAYMLGLIDNEEFKELDIFSDEKLSSFWKELNRFGWPKELKNPEKVYGNGIDMKINMPRRIALMEYIEFKIGKKKCLDVEECIYD